MAVITSDAVRETADQLRRRYDHWHAADMLEALAARCAELEVERAGENTRAIMMFDAKNHWRDRAEAAERALTDERERCAQDASDFFLARGAPETANAIAAAIRGGKDAG